MFGHMIGRRRAHARDRAQSPTEAAAQAAEQETRALVAEVEDLVGRLETVADPQLQQLRKRAEAALDRAKAAGDPVESADGSTRRWALLGVAAACAVVIGLWTRQAVFGD